MLRVLPFLLVTALSLVGGSAFAEPVRQLTHRDRLYDAAAYGGALYAVGHPGLLLRSSDGGKSFENVRAGQTDEALFSIAFNGKGQGAVVGRAGFVLTTPDGGKTWQKSTVTQGAEKPSLFGVAVLPDGVIVAVGEFGAIMRSEDQGKTWSRSPYSIKVAARELTASPAKASKAKGKKAKVSKLAASLSEPTADPSCPATGSAESDNDDVVQEARLADVAFVDEKLGFIVAEFGLVLRTEDGGRTFQRQNSCTGSMLYSVAALSPTRILAVGADGVAVESNDRGLTWAVRATGTPEHLYGVSGNAQHNLVLGAAGLALVRDGEGPFQPVSTGVHGWLTSASIDDNGKGLLVGGRGYLRTTQDGGKTQQRVFGE